MGFRYLAATAVGYGVFMLLLAIWIELHRRSENRDDFDVVDLPGSGISNALDAALVTGIYRRLRKQDTGNWVGSAIRHTWKPAIAIAACLYVVGVAVQWMMPAARTIGDVLR